MREEMMTKYKPFLLRPSCKEYLWGGYRLKEEFDKGDRDEETLAESWECSSREDGPSFVSGGEFDGWSLSKVLKKHPEFIGTHPDGKNGLPILIKLIDADQDLSVQVHPDDAYAFEFENGQKGKTEMWYVLEAQEGAHLVYGLRQTCTKEQIRQAIKEKKIKKYLQNVPVQKDDVFFVEAGTIHALGQGCLVAEVQENSNLTYRLFDYDRKDSNGRTRELHIEKALQVANLSKSEEPRQPLRVLSYKPGVAKELLCRCEYFEVSRLIINNERRQIIEYNADALSFKVLLCLSGVGNLRYNEEVFDFYKGDCIFIPANSVDMTIHGQATLLEVRG
jgi:mannose-6-phosphate isomerase